MENASKVRRKICVVTTSRADYGLLVRLLKEIKADHELELQLIATGMHLIDELGLTYKEIEKDGFVIDRKVDISMNSDGRLDILNSIGEGCTKFGKILQGLNPDIVVVLGDRFELLSVAVSTLILRIPLAHIHGGEATEGAFDEAIRHSITKMAFVHFPATENYRRRIIQLGESPDSVFCYGAPGLDELYRAKIIDKTKLEERLQFTIDNKTAIVVYHPVTLEKGTAKRQVAELMSALKDTGIKAVFIKSNADPGGKLINKAIEAFCKENPQTAKLFDNLSRNEYLGCLKYFGLMIGNSSSGITEAPSFKLPVVNIGDRQRGREKTVNIIYVEPLASSIKEGIKIALSEEFARCLTKLENPYDKYKDGKTSFKIKEKLKDITLEEELLKKKFYDLNFKL